MAYDPWTKKLPKPFPSKTKEFATDSGEVITLTFRKMDILTQYKQVARQKELTALYVGTEDEPPLGFFPPIGEEAVEIPELMLYQASFLECMQPPLKEGQEGERRSAEEFCVIQLVEPPEFFALIQAFSKEVNGENDETVPIPSKADTKP